ncbi:hypothetical protein NHX12_007654 [Muraenolepis orangiensis]|uniref:Uncharacterized protein n=1 Tax=Muraenolepis orangiensis TaxID=630683 RepID=A0A9Q0I9V8_9TELE|nr:hypothetical protein NHX12_007654 [Muraenolepis orangiensis]
MTSPTFKDPSGPPAKLDLRRTVPDYKEPCGGPVLPGDVGPCLTHDINTISIEPGTRGPWNQSPDQRPMESDLGPEAHGIRALTRGPWSQSPDQRPMESDPGPEAHGIRALTRGPWSQTRDQRPMESEP